jgi:hypothetical protein
MEPSHFPATAGKPVKISPKTAKPIKAEMTNFQPLRASPGQRQSKSKPPGKTPANPIASQRDGCRGRVTTAMTMSSKPIETAHGL